MREYLGKSEKEVRQIFNSKSSHEQFSDLMKVARMQPLDLRTGQQMRDGPNGLYERVAVKALTKIATEQHEHLSKNS